MRTPLIFDTDKKFLENLRADPEVKRVPPIITTTFDGASEQLKRCDILFSAFFIGGNVATHEKIPLIREAIRAQPTLPLFLIEHDTRIDLSLPELRALTVRSVIKKPAFYVELTNAIIEAQLAFDSTEVLQFASKNTDILGSESRNVDADFTPILARQFIPGTVCFFDLYIKLPSGRYVLIQRANDALAQDRFDHYIDKGMSHFYIRKEAQEFYLNYCTQLTRYILKKKNVLVDVKLGQVGNQGLETLRFLRENGLKDSMIVHAQSFAKNVQELISELRLSEISAFEKFLKDLEVCEHAVSATMVASLLGKTLGIQTEKSIHILGLASFFHDIGLMDMPEKLRDENESEMTESEKDLYATHPIVGGAMFSKIKGVDRAVIQAIEQHHERRTGDGFPNRLGAGSINRFAEIVGISDLFVRLIKRSVEQPGFNPMVKMEKAYQGFTQPMTAAFQKVFTRQK